MATAAAREGHTAEEIRGEVLRLARSSAEFEDTDPRFAVGTPFPLQGRDDFGANWTLFMPGTAYNTFLIRAAIDDVRKRWDLA